VSALRLSLSAVMTSTIPRSESMVPPLTPPRADTRTSVVSVSCPAPSALAASAVSRTPRSDGTESKPQEATMRAPEATAAACEASIASRTNRASPVRSA